MTIAQNNIKRSVNPTQVLADAAAAIDTSVSINQGDLVVLKSNKLALASAEADGATFLGVMPVTIVSGKLQSPITGTAVDAALAASAVPGPVCGVVCKLTLNTGDSLAPQGLVYLAPSVDAQTVTSTGSKAIGVYQGANISSASAGQQIEVLLGHRFPGDVLVIP